MKLNIKKTIKREICHYASPNLVITSRHNKIYVERDGRETIVKLPLKGWKEIFSFSRKLRRALRLDKCNVVPVPEGLVIVRQGVVYFYDEKQKTLTQTLRLKNCRNLLHQSIAVMENGQEIIFGEYGVNPQRKEVPVYKSSDGGRTWQTIFTFPPGKIRHVHGCYYDPVEDKIWTLTGDFDGESHILCSDKDFRNVEWIGDGTQIYRACNAFFEKDAVHWIMDSHIQESLHIRLDRKTRKIQKLQGFPGPVWYIKRLQDGYYLAATAQEIGAGVKDRYAHLMVSRDLQSWQDLHLFEHDGWPKGYFKFGVIGFADGPQTSNSFYIFAEAVKGLDGKTALCEIVEE